MQSEYFTMRCGETPRRALLNRSRHRDRLTGPLFRTEFRKELETMLADTIKKITPLQSRSSTIVRVGSPSISAENCTVT